MFHAREKEKQRDLLGAEHLYKRALVSFDQALNSDPNDVRLLNNTAKALQKIESINLCRGRNVSTVTELIDIYEKTGGVSSLFNINSPSIYTANNYYSRALRADNNSAITHRNYALFKVFNLIFFSQIIF
jgi:tetratricopeptide (TPR) repeat protein